MNQKLAISLQFLLSILMLVLYVISGHPSYLFVCGFTTGIGTAMILLSLKR